MGKGPAAKFTNPDVKIAVSTVSEAGWTRLKGIAMERFGNVLPLEPRGLNRVKAAAYVGVSPTLFDEMVDDGRMPQPKTVNSRRVWDRKQLDEAFEALPTRDDPNPWDPDKDAAA